MGRPMTEAGFNKRTQLILSKYVASNKKAFEWFASADVSLANGLINTLECFDYYAFLNAMPVVGGYTLPTYNQQTLETYEGSIEAYVQELRTEYEKSKA